MSTTRPTTSTGELLDMPDASLRYLLKLRQFSRRRNRLKHPATERSEGPEVVGSPSANEVRATVSTRFESRPSHSTFCTALGRLRRPRLLTGAQRPFARPAGPPVPLGSAKATLKAQRRSRRRLRRRWSLLGPSATRSVNRVARVRRERTLSRALVRSAHEDFEPLARGCSLSVVHLAVTRQL